LRVIIGVLIVVLILAGLVPWIQPYLPPGYDPFAPLSVDDPPTLITRYKLARLGSDPDACLAALNRAREAGRIAFTQSGEMKGKCPLLAPVRVQNFGTVTLSSSFLASCPLAMSTAMFVAQSATPQAKEKLGSALSRIDHLGSYACRNVYHRPVGRLSEHATADALDVAGFRFADGRSVTVLAGWPRDDATGNYLHAVFNDSCHFFGNSLGPDYNTAHANHFHLGMRGFGVCW
jgi:hypothetical protein